MRLKRRVEISENMIKRIKYGSFSVAVTAIVIAALVIVNIIASTLNDKYPLSLDLTSNSFYTLDKRTEEFIDGLEKDINIYVLGTRDGVLDGEYFASQTIYDVTTAYSYMKNLINTLEELEKQTDKISISYVDLTRNPAFVSSYTDETLLEGSIVVECGDKYRALDYSELFTTDVGVMDESYVLYITASTVEQAVCSAVTNVTSEEQKLVSVLTGHGDETSDALVSLLRDNNFEVKMTDINTESIDEDSQFLIINAPKTDYTSEEIAKLDSFLENGGRFGKNLMIFFDTSQQSLPNLEKFVSDRGISVSRDMIYETDSSRVYGDGIFFRSEYAEEDYAYDSMEKGTYVSVIGSRAVDKVFENSGTFKVTTLLRSSSKSVIKPYDAASDWTADNAEKGSFGTLVVSEDDPMNDPEKASRIYVWGSSYAASASFLNNVSYANSTYLSSLFNTVTDNDKTVTVPSKESISYTVSMTASQVNTIGLVIFTIIVPVAMLVTGSVVYFRRKRL